MNKLPKEISPNPLVSSVVEIRFSTDLKTEDLIGKFYPIMGKDFPIVTYSELPVKLRKSDPILRYNPDFVFSNDAYSISIGTNLLSFENIGTYHLWNNYFELIKTIILKIKQIDIVKKVERVGVRYISLFKPEYKIKEIMKINYVLDYGAYNQTNNFLQTELVSSNFRIVLRMAENGNVKKSNQNLTGLFVDIDASQSSGLPESFNDDLLSIIKRLHDEEKALFFNLLNKEFLETLNPKY